MSFNVINKATCCWHTCVDSSHETMRSNQLMKKSTFEFELISRFRFVLFFNNKITKKNVKLLLVVFKISVISLSMIWSSFLSSGCTGRRMVESTDNRISTPTVDESGRRSVTLVSSALKQYKRQCSIGLRASDVSLYLTTKALHFWQHKGSWSWRKLFQ